MDEEIVMSSSNFRQLCHELNQDLTELLLTQGLNACRLEKEDEVAH